MTDVRPLSAEELTECRSFYNVAYPARESDVHRLLATIDSQRAEIEGLKEDWKAENEALNILRSAHRELRKELQGRQREHGALHDVSKSLAQSEDERARAQSDIIALKARAESAEKRVAWLESGDVHTCHDECEREACVLTRQLAQARREATVAANQRDDNARVAYDLAEERDDARAWAKRWKAAAKEHDVRRAKAENHARGSDQDYERACDERDEALALASRYRGALEEIRGGHWIEGVKQRGPYLGYEVHEIAAAALSTPAPTALAQLRKRHFEEAAGIAEAFDVADANFSPQKTTGMIAAIRAAGEVGRE